MHSSRVKLTFVLLLCLVAAVISFSGDANLNQRANRLMKRPPPLFICPEAFGKYPIADDCQRYYLCWQYSNQAKPLHTIRTCPSKMLFDVRLQTCVYYKFAICHEEETDFTCPSGNGVFRNKQCDRFWLCHNGLQYLKYCPYGYKFDTIAGRCLPWLEAQCEEQTPPSLESGSVNKTESSSEDSVISGEDVPVEMLPSTMVPGTLPWKQNKTTTVSISEQPVWTISSEVVSSTRTYGSSTTSTKPPSTSTITPDTTTTSYSSTSVSTQSPSSTSSTKQKPPSSTTTTTQDTTTSYSSPTVSTQNPSSTSTWTTARPSTSTQNNTTAFSSTVPYSSTVYQGHQTSISSPSSVASSSSTHFYQTTTAGSQNYQSTVPSWQPSNSTVNFSPTPNAPQSLVKTSTTKRPSLVCKYVYL